MRKLAGATFQTQKEKKKLSFHPDRTIEAPKSIQKVFSLIFLCVMFIILRRDLNFESGCGEGSLVPEQEVTTCIDALHIKIRCSLASARLGDAEHEEKEATG